MKHFLVLSVLALIAAALSHKTPPAPAALTSTAAAGAGPALERLPPSGPSNTEDATELWQLRSEHVELQARCEALERQLAARVEAPPPVARPVPAPVYRTTYGSYYSTCGPNGCPPGVNQRQGLFGRR